MIHLQVMTMLTKLFYVLAENKSVNKNKKIDSNFIHDSLISKTALQLVPINFHACASPFLSSLLQEYLTLEQGEVFF